MTIIREDNNRFIKTRVVVMASFEIIYYFVMCTAIASMHQAISISFLCRCSGLPLDSVEYSAEISFPVPYISTHVPNWLECNSCALSVRIRLTLPPTIVSSSDIIYCKYRQDWSLFGKRRTSENPFASSIRGKKHFAPIRDEILIWPCLSVWTRSNGLVASLDSAILRGLNCLFIFPIR